MGFLFSVGLYVHACSSSRPGARGHAGLAALPRNHGILQHGLNDPCNTTELMVWRDISELILAEEVSRLEKTVDDLLAYIAAYARKEI